MPNKANLLREVGKFFLVPDWPKGKVWMDGVNNLETVVDAI